MEEPPTIYDLMQRFETLSRAVIFTANEVALFHVLLHSWNIAHRPAVIEEWADKICRRSGLTKHSLPTARNKLVQKGVVSYEKTGRRGPARYRLFPLSGNRSGNRIGIEAGIGSESSQGKGKGTREGPEPPPAAPPPDLPDSTTAIPTIEQAERYAKSAPAPVPIECVGPWMDSRTSVGWENHRGQPIRDWRADLRGFARHWLNHEMAKGNTPKPPHKPVEGPPGWREVFRQLIPSGQIPIQWDHVDPGLQGDILSELKTHHS